MNLNKVMILGNLTRDPELRQTPAGQPVCTFDVATNRVWLSPSGEKNQKTEFHRIVAWGRLAEICGQYLAKGRLVFVEGRVETRSWQDKESGAKRYRTEIIAESMQMGPRTSASGGAAEPSSPPTSNEPATIEYPTETADIEVKDIPF
ncbi:MAG: single-stranded DNA-binding protein [Candidatus Sungbacteria bacterium]|uniref:Single-stranded DNA-binding protein n=1 Tax=Candidatus Sungiibacteriota bacterium TaxID=2750080 RepID=A0A931SC85_9BACT|nr:single-stranded DNA-binding protein [Candidatus Sungbacteria bacterium]